MGYPQMTPNGWFMSIMENPIKVDDLEVPLFQETPISQTMYLISINPSGKMVVLL